MRYRLYGEWEKDDERIPMVLAARQTAKVYLFIQLEFIFCLAKLGALQVSFCFTVGHSKNFEKTCQGKSKAVGSNGCKTSSCQSNDRTSNNCSPGIV